ncbi:MAG: exodeoxyribonuclease VII large subunit [Bacteroidetes bacterium]|nr:exodeoxyribonuclease VII large subunit [Bacteroidota bacterium]
MNQKKIFTLKQVVKSIQKTFDERYKQAYWIKVELHKLNQYPTGHCFPELVHKENDKIVAQLNGTIWKTTLDNINKRFHEIVKEPIKEGTTLLILAKIQYHPTFGAGLLILDIDPHYSLGELQREKDETLLYLQKHNLLNKNKSLSFPLLPKRIAIISAETSKGLSDFFSVLSKREPNYYFVTHLFRAALQGDAAVQSIVRQLDKIEKLKDLFDVVVIVRGGGGEAGLTCYNHLTLCKKIANFPLPILTGIGHSTNTTVAEMIAFENGITPTELAEMLIRCFDVYSEPLIKFKSSIEKTTQQFIKTHLLELHAKSELLKARSSKLVSNHQMSNRHLSEKVAQSCKRFLQERKSLQTNLTNKLAVKTKSLLTQFKSDTKNAGQYLSFHSSSLLKDYRLKTNQLQSQISLLPPQKLELLHTGINVIEDKIKILSPEQVLKRGFTITHFNGKSVSNENQPKIGDKITTFTSSEKIESSIQEIINKT